MFASLKESPRHWSVSCKHEGNYSRRQNKVPDSVPCYGRKTVVFCCSFTIAFYTVLTKWPTPFTKTMWKKKNG